MTLLGLLALLLAGLLAYAAIENYKIGCLFSGKFVKRGTVGC